MDFKADSADAMNNREELDLVIRTISAIVSDSTEGTY